MPVVETRRSAITGPASCCAYVNTVYSTVPWQTGYVWTISPSGTIVSGQGTKTVTVQWTATGTQWIGLNYTNLSGCSAPTPTIKNVTVNLCPSNPIVPDTSDNYTVINSIDVEPENVDLYIYPNPNDGSFTAIISAQEPGTYHLQIFSNLGVMVYESRDLQVSGTFRKEIDISNVANGVYNFVLINKDRSIQKRVIIRK